MNLFDLESTPFRFSKDREIKIFTTFSGIGCQEMALSRIIKNYEVLGFAEIDNSAIKSYSAIHGNIKNYGDICKIKGVELPKEIDIFTYSFPCTDLSKAGKQKGLNIETRSGLVFEVLRLLKELKVEKNLPKVLIMENVPDLLSPKFKEGWHTIYNEIESMGYENYVSILNSKDYGIPQNRNRVFMVSVPRGYYYEFPNKTKLVIKLKDLLEKDVLNKYYLTQKQISQIQNWKGSYTMNSSMILIKQKGNSEDIYKLKENDRPRDRIYSIENDAIFTMTTKVDQMPLIMDIIPTLKTSCTDIGVIDGYRIRRITPLESWRFMGIFDEDFHKAKNAGVSDSQLYKQAGNGIVVNVMEAILKQLF